MVAKEILKERKDSSGSGVLGCTTEITQDRESRFIFIYLTNMYKMLYVCGIILNTTDLTSYNFMKFHELSQSPLNRWVNWDTEQLSILSKDTQ